MLYFTSLLVSWVPAYVVYMYWVWLWPCFRSCWLWCLSSSCATRPTWRPQTGAHLSSARSSAGSFCVGHLYNNYCSQWKTCDSIHSYHHWSCFIFTYYCLKLRYKSVYWYCLWWTLSELTWQGPFWSEKSSRQKNSCICISIYPYIIDFMSTKKHIWYILCI